MIASFSEESPLDLSTFHGWKESFHLQTMYHCDEIEYFVFWVMYWIVVKICLESGEVTVFTEYQKDGYT